MGFFVVGIGVIGVMGANLPTFYLDFIYISPQERNSMTNVKIALYTGKIVRCHKCLRQIFPHQPKIVIGVGFAASPHQQLPSHLDDEQEDRRILETVGEILPYQEFEVYHPSCYESSVEGPRE